MGFILKDKYHDNTRHGAVRTSSDAFDRPEIPGLPAPDDLTKDVPVFGNWKNFTTKDGLPSDKCFCVRIDGDKVYVGTHDGLAVYENIYYKRRTVP